MRIVWKRTHTIFAFTGRRVLTLPTIFSFPIKTVFLFDIPVLLCLSDLYMITSKSCDRNTQTPDELWRKHADRLAYEIYEYDLMTLFVWIYFYIYDYLRLVMKLDVKFMGLRYILSSLYYTRFSRALPARFFSHKRSYRIFLNQLTTATSSASLAADSIVYSTHARSRTKSSHLSVF